ncbi:MAG: UDP-N-acetylmuramate dehydrogenase [Ignavibacteriales bacterium]|nr:UDP-N-acetylmuramate dehydrogenase [Ignavibacteriales bacterium]
MLIEENVSLKRYNSFGVDANARYFVEIKTEDDLQELLTNHEFKNERKLFLGGGSNILFTNDYDGLIAKISTKGNRVVEENDKEVLVESAAGEKWNDFVTYCVEKGFYGVENLSLIPGTVGAAPIQNIGAYGAELKDVFVSLDGIMIDSGEKKSFSKQECQFDYRDSIFKKKYKNSFLITKVVLRLKKEQNFNLNYRAFQSYLKPGEQNKLTLREMSELVKRIRRDKLPNPQKYGNAGSFFKNPEVDLKKIHELQEKFIDLVHFKVEEDKYKISAGWLIEKCGFRGKNIGKVGTYKKQALVIINFGGATGEEIKKFSESIQKAVQNKFGINLNPEVNIY